ncbi:unnamed protein product [Vitrella brassicaformis CCMP3155]|uniref:Mitochondrial carrier protein n=2 Tax=Vitrella brassicaformis TaxID=1169539 RepID=A0A0G4F0K4_VITBC|nr:unnamed protein product [Vitrella brassicaformis CCMP3155]|eukprot:CEM05258.1 unnamed protein product [Vitrella brassicaformis CCMP3155]
MQILSPVWVIFLHGLDLFLAKSISRPSPWRSATAEQLQAIPARPFPAAVSRRRNALLKRRQRHRTSAAAEKVSSNNRSGHGNGGTGLLSFISGAIAGVIVATVTNPLEVVKTQMQASGGQGFLATVAAVHKASGVTGFFAGLTPSLIGVIPSRSTYFWAYSTAKNALNPMIGDGALTHFTSALVAGFVAYTVINPISMVRTRLFLDAAASETAAKGVLDAVRSIWMQEGVRGFSRGVVASYWGISEGCVHWMIFEPLKKQLSQREAERTPGSVERSSQQRASVGPTLVAGFVAKAVASTATYPHEVIRTRLREQTIGTPAKYTGFFQSFRLIAREEGVRGLYAGMFTHLLRVVPSSALVLVCYEVVYHTLERGCFRPKAARQEPKKGVLDGGLVRR